MNELDKFPHVNGYRATPTRESSQASERPKYLSGRCVEQFGQSGQSKKNANILVRTSKKNDVERCPDSPRTVILPRQQYKQT